MSKLNDASTVKQQYSTANNLNIRMSIHNKYSTNKMGFGNWVVSNYEIDKGMSVLELGCGTGDIWKNREALIRKCKKLILSDLSEKILDTARNNIGDGNNIEYKVLDIQDIPYDDEIFDIVIANMMLYHVPDIAKGLSEVRRVLKKGGCFYCATYGEHGIMEYLSDVFSAYGVKDNINKNFTLQNGYGILSETFSCVEKLEYIDSLAITEVDDMVDYIFSMSGMTSLSDVPKHIIKDVLMRNLTNGILNVPKEYGMFVAS